MSPDKAMPCLLCSHLISVYDTSAGCQDPERSHPECDRLAAVEAPVESSGASPEPPAAESTTPDPTPTSDPTEYQTSESTGMAQS